MVTQLQSLADFASSKPTEKMPVVFIGHGSPMNAILETDFTLALNQLGKDLPLPTAVLCISAHWMTEGTWVTHMPAPRTIHDFYYFPQELFDIQYPAPGAPEVADYISKTIKQPKIVPDDEIWGLDHGTWSVLKHLYPQADVPILQLSLYMSKSPQHHFDLGQQLKQLRQKGILIIGSGNIVHNLGIRSHEQFAKPFDWAVEFDEWVKNHLINRNSSAIINEARNSEAGKLSIPSQDHWYPLLYTLGASDDNDNLRFIHEGLEHASISMRTVVWE